MRDRQPTQPGRVKITPENGDSYFAVVEMADEPTEFGTPPTKENLLTDMTCDVLNIPRTSVVNDALLSLALGVGKYGYVFRVTYSNGTPAEGVTITGMNSPSGGALITDKNGVAVGVSESESTTVTAQTDYTDLKNSISKSVQSTGKLTNVGITLEEKDGGYVMLTSSGSIKFSPAVKTFDATAVGAGGGGASFNHCCAGGGGFIKSLLGISVSQYNALSFTIGAGGARGGPSPNKDGKDGGATTLFGDSTPILTANGGKGGKQADRKNFSYGLVGTGNGDGGVSYFLIYNNYPDALLDGKAAAGFLFDEPGLGVPGGGGGGSDKDGGRTNAGAPNGGLGSYARQFFAESGKAPGGGGGAGNTEVSGEYGYGGNGGNGALFVRWHYEGVS